MSTQDGGTSSTTTSIFGLHQDILRAHILTRLDGPTLVSTSCTSTQLHSLASQEQLWSKICRSTWPSTESPRVLQVISTFPSGSRSFFSSSFPLLLSSSPLTPAKNTDKDRDLPSELISAVDIYYKNDLVFSKVVETETVSDWFKCSPFRIDMLDPKDTCQTNIPRPDNDEGCLKLGEELKLSWILIDPVGRRAVNLSSLKPVLVQKHWLSGEVHALFGTVVRAGKGVVHCGMLVTCGGGARGGRVGMMQVREVSLQMEDLDGMFLNGRDSLGILHGAFEGKRGIKGRERKEGKRSYDYEEFLELKRERKESRLRKEGMLDMLCVGFGFILFASLGLFLLLR